MSLKGVCRSSCSEANKQARLVENEVCFFQTPESGEQEGGGRLSKGRLPPSLTNRGESFYGQSQRWGGYMQRQRSRLWQASTERSSAVWPGLPGRFRHSLQSQAHLSRFSAVSSRNWGSSCPGSAWSSLVNSSTWGFRVYKTAHRTWLRIWSVVIEKELNVLDGA